MTTSQGAGAFDMIAFDVIVVGAGPAGCALSARLADARPDLSIALLESGPGQHPSIVHTPIGIAATVPRRGERNYGYRTAPQRHLNDRRGFQPRGRGVGGSSLINAMIYIRGQREDYDGWRDLGCDGWGWDDLLPYFMRSEGNARGADPLHGADGPLQVADLRDLNPVSGLFIKAGVEAGFPENRDFNGPQQEGVGPYQVFQKGGERWNASRAYLEGRQRTNLSVLPGCQVARILFTGQRATGVALHGEGGQERQLSARLQVVLSAGAFGSPQLLLASGIGPESDLRALGITIKADAPEVGQNLQDHLDYTVARISSNRQLVGVTPGFALQFLWQARLYKKERRGLLASNIAEAGGFLKTMPTLDRPDIQLHFCVSLVDDHGRKRHYNRGFSVHVCGLRPESRGTVTLASADVREAPVIDPRFLSEQADLDTLIRGVRLVHRILDAPSMRGLTKRPLYDTNAVSDEALTALIRQRADTIYHPVGTCRMGSDARSVVDSRLRVRGVDGLRVADASIMPTLISGNTQAPSAVIGEKAADLLLADLQEPAARTPALEAV